ncbi:rubrerythrin-related [Anaeramoeba flamelloides]|uniref:Rubrerythrin-related n=1 Tax=Anaeramoeba flamelloides TaxID=1746091 RepID=A0AAV7Z5D4_9EUKA|nr:rubrerythrin-related [Anaeramoeba flamelloides]
MDSVSKYIKIGALAAILGITVFEAYKKMDSEKKVDKKEEKVEKKANKDKNTEKKSLDGTQTLKNLMSSFAGESQARMRYEMMAKKAEKEGFKQIAEIFRQTALEEVEHAKRFYKYLSVGSTEKSVEVSEAFPSFAIGNTQQNLMAAAFGEEMEESEVYPSFAKIARKEGFEEIAKTFENVAIAESGHKERFSKFAQNIKKGEVFRLGNKVWWRCKNCGYLHFGESAPEKCPACNHPQEYFEIKPKNY